VTLRKTDTACTEGTTGEDLGSASRFGHVGRKTFTSRLGESFVTLDVASAFDSGTVSLILADGLAVSDGGANISEVVRIGGGSGSLATTWLGGMGENLLGRITVSGNGDTFGSPQERSSVTGNGRRGRRRVSATSASATITESTESTAGEDMS